MTDDRQMRLVNQTFNHGQVWCITSVRKLEQMLHGRPTRSNLTTRKWRKRSARHKRHRCFPSVPCDRKHAQKTHVRTRDQKIFTSFHLPAAIRKLPRTPNRGEVCYPERHPPMALQGISEPAPSGRFNAASPG